MSRKKYQVFDFETKNQKKGFIKIHRDMVMSKAWKKLTTRQVGLYFIFKSKFTINHGDSNKDNIMLTTKEISPYYKGNMEAFRKDVDTLIEYGFIRQISSGYINKTPSIYGFSNKWSLYGTKDFKIQDNERRYKRTKFSPEEAE